MIFLKKQFLKLLSISFLWGFTINIIEPSHQKSHAISPNLSTTPCKPREIVLNSDETKTQTQYNSDETTTVTIYDKNNLPISEQKIDTDNTIISELILNPNNTRTLTTFNRNRTKTVIVYDVHQNTTETTKFASNGNPMWKITFNNDGTETDTTYNVDRTKQIIKYNTDGKKILFKKMTANDNPIISLIVNADKTKTKIMYGPNSKPNTILAIGADNRLIGEIAYNENEIKAVKIYNEENILISKKLISTNMSAIQALPFQLQSSRKTNTVNPCNPIKNIQKLLPVIKQIPRPKQTPKRSKRTYQGKENNNAELDGSCNKKSKITKIDYDETRTRKK